MKIVLVDSFTQTPFTGNPAAVCLLETALDDTLMQKIAAEMNLSGNTLLLNIIHSFTLIDYFIKKLLLFIQLI